MVNNLFSVEGLAVIVTGAARGNGRAIADGFHERGAVVYYADVLAEALHAIPRSATARAVLCDVTKTADTERLVDGCLSDQGRIDVLVNNAGISLPSSDPYDAADDTWTSTLAVNLTGAFAMSRRVAKAMAARGRGSIINITSLGAAMGFPGNPSYQASKAALRQLTRAMAKDFGSSGVRINNLCPGYIRTEMTRQSHDDPALRAHRTDRTLLKRWGTSGDLVGPCIFLASDAAGYISGSDLVVDGGWLANGL